MTAIKNNGTAVAEQKNETVTAVVVSAPVNVKKNTVNLPADLIEPSDYNARKTIDPDALRELSQNIARHGLIQPITVRRTEGKGDREHYEIICGERRFRACRMLQWKEIPAIVTEATDEQAYDLSISENLQREDVPPMEAAVAYKRLIDTKRHDVASLAVQYGKSEKHIYQMLKLCDLIPGIAKLVQGGRLSASAGVVISKYDKKMQADILKDRLGEDGRGEWCHVSAVALEGKIQSCYTNKLENYRFDKTKCLKCPHNSDNFDLFAEGGGCGRCTDEKCLKEKQTAFLVAEAEALAVKDPKLTFVGDQYGYGCEAKQIVKQGGYEFKNVQTYNLKSYPTAPTVPQTIDYKKSEDFDKAQAQYEKAQERYAKQTAHLDELKEQGKIRVYADITRDAVTLHYKEVATQDVKTNAQLIAELTDKKKRNSEIANEKTAGDIKELLRTGELPQSDFTPDEETAMYFFMLSKLRRSHFKAIGLKEGDYYGLTDEKKLKIAGSLTQQQKTVIRRDYLYSHLTGCTNTVGDTVGGMLLAFSRQHLPEKTATVENTYKEEYGKKNARLDERIKGLKDAEKRAKADAKATTAEQPAKPEKRATTDEKATETTAPAIPATVPAKTGTKSEQQPVKSPASDKILIVGVPKPTPKPASGAVAQG